LNIDIYKIFKLEPNFEMNELKERFNKLAKKYHPDKLPSGKSEKREEYATKFELVNNAYKILSDPFMRRMYDDLRKLNTLGDSKTYTELQMASRNYLETNLMKIPTEHSSVAEKQAFEAAKAQAQVEFTKQWSKLNEKHGFDTTTVAPALKEEETKDLLAKMMKERESLSVTNIFGTKKPEDISSTDFNKMFEHMKRKEQQEIQRYNMPQASNMMGAADLTVYHENTFDNLYQENTMLENNQFARINNNNFRTGPQPVTDNELDDILNNTTLPSLKPTEFETKMMEQRMQTYIDQKAVLAKVTKATKHAEPNFMDYGILNQLTNPAMAGNLMSEHLPQITNDPAKRIGN
jgi:curved DNA-binding protein CbpA